MLRPPCKDGFALERAAHPAQDHPALGIKTPSWVTWPQACRPTTPRRHRQARNRKTKRPPVTHWAQLPNAPGQARAHIPGCAGCTHRVSPSKPETNWPSDVENAGPYPPTGWNSQRARLLAPDLLLEKPRQNCSARRSGSDSRDPTWNWRRPTS